MRFLVCILLFCAARQVTGQAKSTHLPINRKGNTSIFWYQWMVSLERKTNLVPLDQSSHPFHFRMSSTGREIVEIWQQDGVFFGSFTEWVKDADEELRPFEKFYYQHYTLSKILATAIGQFVINSGILQLPSEENIKDWQQGLDGEEVIVQYANNENYYLKNYWTPSAQHDLPEALLIEQFRSKLLELANATIVWKSFQAEIPFPCFTNDNAFTTCQAVNSTRYLQHKREVIRYVHKMKEKGK